MIVILLLLVKPSSLSRPFHIITWVLFGMLMMFIVFLFIGIALEDQQKISDGADLADVIPTVVNIICPERGQQLTLESEGQGGSGVMMDKDGLIYTNAHIFQDEDYNTIDLHPEGCLVMIPDAETGYPVEVYKAQPSLYGETSNNYDLATLQIYEVYEDEEGPWGEYPKQFTTLSPDFCIDAPLQLGESMKIFGYPEATGGISLTITEGVVSSFSEDGYVLTSAKINYGNSGGLAVDARGCFIGIPSAFIEDEVENYGIIIPTDIIQTFEEEAGFLEE